MSEGVFFDRDSAEKIARVVRQELMRQQVLPRAQRRPSPGSPRDIEFGKADSTISAATTSGVFGNGTCSIYTFTSTGGTTDTGENLTAWNMSLDTVAAGPWLQFKRHFRTGRWLIDFEDCATT